MATSDVVMIIAVLLGPIAAVQVSTFLERRREAHRRRLRVFKTLMTTRATKLAPIHVEALNTIDIEFTGSDPASRAVREAWKAYLDHLNTHGVPLEVWGTKNDDLFVELMSAMARNLGYDFDKTHLRRASYYPQGFGEMEVEQQAIRKGLAKVLGGNMGLPVVVYPPARESTDAPNTGRVEPADPLSLPTGGVEPTG